MALTTSRAFSTPITATRTTNTTTETPSARPKLTPRPTSTGVNLDIRHAFALAAAKAKKLPSTNTTTDTGTDSQVQIATVATTVVAIGMGMGMTGPRRAPVQKRRSVDLEALTGPLKRRKQGGRLPESGQNTEGAPAKGPVRVGRPVNSGRPFVRPSSAVRGQGFVGDKGSGVSATAVVSASVAKQAPPLSIYSDKTREQTVSKAHSHTVPSQPEGPAPKKHKGGSHSFSPHLSSEPPSVSASPDAPSQKKYSSEAHTYAALTAKNVPKSVAVGTADGVLGPPSPPLSTAEEGPKKEEKEKDKDKERKSVSKEEESEGRKLRSQETTRYKSELATYFPEYDIIIGNDAKTPQDTLDPEKPIHLQGTPSLTNYPFKTYPSCIPIPHPQITLAKFPPCPPLDIPEDPLPDSIYIAAHRKPARQERTVKNAERVRAQHEKDQVVRLLGALQGPDWLKVLGVASVSGVESEAKRKHFEGAREYFVGCCEGVLEKFRVWAVEEKRRKEEKERGAVVFPALLKGNNKEKKAEKELISEIRRKKQRKKEENRDEAEEVKQSIEEVDKVPDSEEEEDDGDKPIVPKRSRKQTLATPAHQRAPSKSKCPMTHRFQSLPPASTSVPTPTAASAPEPKLFVSFFAKRHERDAAVNRHRRGGRKVLAFGVPVPEVAEREFEVPGDIKEDVLVLRRKGESGERRAKREERGKKMKRKGLRSRQ